MRTIHFDARAVVRWGAVLAGLLVLATVVFEVAADFAPDNDVFAAGVGVFSLLKEDNVGVFGATLLLLACGVAALAVAWLTEAGSRWLWGSMAVGFPALAADEMLVVHERFGRVAEAVLGDSAPSFAWIVPGVIIVVLIGVVLLPRLWQLPTATRNGLLLAAAVFLGGALGLEAVGSWLFEREGAPDHLAGGLALIEETLEVVGTVIALWVMANHVEEHLLPLRIEASRPSAREPTEA